MSTSSPGALIWFDLQDLQSVLDPQNWSRGQSLFLHNRVLSIDIAPDGAHWRVTGMVQGEQRLPYQTSAAITLDSASRLQNWSGACSCPVGQNCKHAVALSIKAAYQGRRLLQQQPHARPPAAQLEQARLAEQAQLAQKALQAADRQWQDWLEKIAVSRGPATAAGPSSAHERAEQYLYVLTSATHEGVTQLQLTLVSSYLKVNGGWAKPRSVGYEPYPGQRLYDCATPADHQVLRLMRACKPLQGRYGYSFPDAVLPSGEAGTLLLRKAASTGRLMTRASNGYPQDPIEWGEPQALAWRWQDSPPGDAGEPVWRLLAELDSPGALLCKNDPPLYLDAERGRCGLVDVQGLSMTLVQALFKAPAVRESVLRKHQDRLSEQLGMLALPAVLEPVEVISGLLPQACLHLSSTTAPAANPAGLICARISFDYAGQRGWWTTAQANVPLPAVEPDGPRRLLQRDMAAEQRALNALAALGLQVTPAGELRLSSEADPLSWLHWADSDYAALRQAGFALTLEPSLHDWVQRADGLQLQMQAEGDDEQTSPWFDLSLGIEINGQRRNVLPWLPELIALAARAAPAAADTAAALPEHVYLRDPAGPGFVRLPGAALQPWLSALLELVGERGLDLSGEQIKLSRLQALRTGAALGEGVSWAGAPSLQRLLQHMRGPLSLPDVALPPTVQAKLRPYQQQGLNWLQFLRQNALAGILADDMGLGKTLQTLAHIQVEKDAGRLDRPALIIAPVSLLGNWQREAQRFCPTLRCLLLHGLQRHEKAEQIIDHDVVIAPYSLLQRDRDRWLQLQWHVVVLDEAQNIKNASTQAAQVACELHTRHRLCLSGTPMENHLGEVWSLFHFLMPGFLGSQARFKELFRNPIERSGSPERMAQLRARITPFMLRRTKALVAKELPPKVETIARVELAGKQADLYETIRLSMEKTVREALETKGLAKSQIAILDALLKLRQVCCDPRLLALDAAQKIKRSAKLDHLMELLPEMLEEGRRVLLFSQFTSMLTLIEVELKKRGLNWVKLTGQSQKRDQLIERFTSGAVPLFLISLKAGGVGLNLPQADTVIHYDPWWNPAVENQATDRAHRIGQQHSVWVLKLVAQGTIEERILALQERKAALANEVYSGSAARREPLFAESDLAELLKPLGQS
ncbi:DEAD/DEAH box helicase [Hydrogenophaga sp.]|uniref:DEAD/DEAH box helicase n=1 Tax=Hydrogenophaga sp. TaxID=1904254 RepID=UPI0019855846|nr:DEAD/DEAH box helicase [Hydrogenophaga sp.]MBD3892844.1 helicase SNF2 [Hydrogenophaga sp.]